MKVITLIVPCVPVAEPRKRHKRVKTKAGREFTQTYTPAKDPVNAYKASIQHEAKIARVTPIDGPIRLSMLFLFPRPQRMIWKRKPMPRAWHTSKPDRDNVEKATMDALNRIAWFDDAQVCAGPILKQYCAGDEAPQAIIKIRSLSA